MSGKKIGYIRVSTYDQNPDRQLEGLKLNRKFIDKISGRTIVRPQLTALLEYARDDDTIYIHSMDRLARNVDDLRTVVNKLNKKKAIVSFVKEGLTFTGEDSPMSQLMLTMLGAFAQFENALIKERRKEGIAIAKKNGVYKGRKPVMDDEKMQLARELLADGKTKVNVASELQISRETLYKHLKKYRTEHPVTGN